MRILKLLAVSLALVVTSATAAPPARTAAAPAAVAVLTAFHPGGTGRSPGFGAAPEQPRVPRGWGLLLAGLVGAWAIGRRRTTAIGDRALTRHRAVRR